MRFVSLLWRTTIPRISPHPILLSPCLSVPRLNQYHLSLLFLRGGKGGCSGSVSFLSPLGAGERHFLLPPPPPVSSRQIGNFFRPPFLLLGAAKTATSVSLYIVPTTWNPLRGHVHPHIPFSRKKRRSRKGGKGFRAGIFLREKWGERQGACLPSFTHRNILPTGFFVRPTERRKSQTPFFLQEFFFPLPEKKGNQSNVTFKTQGSGGLKKIFICLRLRTEIGFLKDEAKKVVLVL